MDAANPMQIVETSALHIFMASYIPIPIKKKYISRVYKHSGKEVMESRMVL